MNTCPNCGLLIEPGAYFCGNCGQRLNVEIITANNSIPPYAVEAIDPAAKRGEVQATIGLLLGVIAITSSIFIPLVALVLGVAGLVLSTISRSKYRHTLSIMAIVISAVGLLSGVGIWGYAASKSVPLKLAQGNADPTKNLVAINTPCYEVSIDSGLNNYRPTNCNFDAASTAEEFSVNAVANPNITATDLGRVAQTVFKNAIAKSGGTYLYGFSGTFAKSPAYIVYASNASQQTESIFAMVVHSSSAVDNVYIVGRAIRTTYKPSFGALESSWQWK